MKTEYFEWASVKDGYPEETEEVLVTDGEDYAVGWYREDADAWENINYGWLERDANEDWGASIGVPKRLGKITHWMRFKKLNDTYKEHLKTLEEMYAEEVGSRLNGINHSVESNREKALYIAMGCIREKI